MTSQGRPGNAREHNVSCLLHSVRRCANLCCFAVA